MGPPRGGYFAGVRDLFGISRLNSRVKVLGEFRNRDEGASVNPGFLFFVTCVVT